MLGPNADAWPGPALRPSDRVLPGVLGEAIGALTWSGVVLRMLLSLPLGVVDRLFGLCAELGRSNPLISESVSATTDRRSWFRPLGEADLPPCRRGASF